MLTVVIIMHNAKARLICEPYYYYTSSLTFKQRDIASAPNINN